jgi:hypothetical protein
MMWFSNGGRSSAPWNGEHIGVLGIEEACALGIEGRAASVAPNHLTARGIATAIDLGSQGMVSVTTAMGAFACSALAPQSLLLDHETLRLDDGTMVPFQSAHFG